LTRALLKLYPRRIRNRYGDELLDLQDELRSQGNLSRARLIRDTLAGAVLVRPVRERARLVITAVLVIVGLTIAGSIIAGAGTSSPAHTSRLQARAAVPHVNAAPYGSCFVATGSSCSLAACTQFTGQTSAEGAVVYSSEPASKRQSRLTKTRCASHALVVPQRPVFVARVVQAAHPRPFRRDR
jgi:hypothetical protein